MSRASKPSGVTGARVRRTAQSAAVPSTKGRVVAEKREARKREVAQAALGVIAREGVEGASLRGIAAVLGCTTGSLTHYFRDKDDLINFVLDELTGSLSESLSRIDVAAITDDALQTLIQSMLPHDAEMRRWWTVWIAFTASSLSDDAMRSRQAQRDAVVLAKMTDIIAAVFARRGLRPPREEVAAEAELLLCFVDGLGLHAVEAPRRFSAERQAQLLAMHLDGLARRWGL